MPATRKKKKFIDKKNAVSFHLVHRSQKDPLQADEDAPQRVLLPAASDRAKQLEEQQKYGIYFDDDYDYMQHLKEVSEVTEWVPAKSAQENDEVMSEASAAVSEHKLQLPGSVFASTVERDVGLLNMAAPSSGPKLDWDPDVMAALDDDFKFDDPDNELEDDFVLKANASGDEDEMEGDDEELDDDFVQQAGGAAGGGYMLAEYMRRNLQLKEQEGHGDDEEDGDDEGSDVDSDEVEYSGDEDFSDDDDDDEKGGKGTYSRYSVSSSVLPRNDKLKLLDAWFDKMVEDYNDDNIGALDHEELNGRVTMDSDLMKQALDDFDKWQQKQTMKDVVDSKDRERPVIKEEEGSGSEAESDTEYEWREVKDNKPKWDCETIISTYSTTKNLPKTIYTESEIRRMERAEKKEMAEEEPKPLTAKDIEKEMAMKDRADRASTFRPKGETAEERKARKKAVKLEQMERRMEKKANKLAFREEHNRQTKQKANSSANQGARIEYR